MNIKNEITMKYLYIMVLFVFAAPLQYANAQTLSLETVIEQALQNSPETARILKTVEDANADAFEIETLQNPTVEVDTTALTNNASRSIGIELEQPMKASNFETRKPYADALRYTANIEQKAQILELIHSITRGYSAYWILQEQEKLLSENLSYARKQTKLIKRGAQQGLLDIADAKIFQAEILRLNEQIRVLRAKKENGAANILRMAGMKQVKFQAKQPETTEIPQLASLMSVAMNEASIRSLLESRRSLAERRYNVAKQDSEFPAFAPRAVIDHDFDEGSTAILFGVNITIPIWDRNNAELARARAERQLAYSNLSAMNEHNFANVLAASFKQAKASQISAAAYKNKIVPAWNNVQSIIDRKFQNGQASILDLIQMRERIMDVQSASLQTYLNSIEARIKLESLIGQSLKDIKGIEQ